MTPNTLHSFLLPACKPLFPEHLMDSNAQAMMLAIGLQESDLKHRQQLIGRNRNWWQSINGPATGFWQFEKIGIKGVIEHRTAGPMFKTVCDLLGYPTNVNVIHKAVINNDILAVALARCLLWMVPEKLPGVGEAAKAWDQYLSAWRPGKPSPLRWEDRYILAWDIVNGASPSLSHKIGIKL